jgi:hypothetical protein
MRKAIVLFFFFSITCYSQFKGHSGVYYLGTANIPINQKIFDNPNINGVVVRFRWNDIEPSPDNFNWSFIDGELTKAKNSNKNVSIQPLGVPEWMDSLGAKQYFYVDNNTYHSTYGQIVSDVLPWDNIYVERYKILISKLVEKYSLDTTVSYVNTIGGAFSRNLPDSVIVDTVSKITKPFWKAFNYNADTFAILINKMTDFYMEHFPKTPLWCSVDYVRFEINASGRPLNYLTSLITKYGIEKYPDRFGLWREDLAGCNPQTNIGTGSQWYIMKMNPCRTGAQMLWSVQDGPSRMNKCGILPNDKATILDSAIKKGLAMGMRYMEIYGADISDVSLSNVIQNANNLLINQGENCTKGTDVQEEIHTDDNIMQFVGNDFINLQDITDEIKIYDVMGRLIITFNDTKIISLSFLNEGLYFIKIGNKVYKFCRI